MFTAVPQQVACNLRKIVQMVARSEKQAAASCDLEPALTAFRSQFLPVHTGSFGPEGEHAWQVNDAVGDEFQGRQDS